MTLAIETHTVASDSAAPFIKVDSSRQDQLIKRPLSACLHQVRGEVSMGRVKVIHPALLGLDEGIFRILTGRPQHEFRRGSEPAVVDWSWRVASVRSGSLVVGSAPLYLQRQDLGLNVVELPGLKDPTTGIVQLPEARIRVISGAGSDVNLDEIIRWIAVRSPPSALEPMVVELHYMIHGLSPIMGRAP